MRTLFIRFIVICSLLLNCWEIQIKADSIQFTSTELNFIKTFDPYQYVNMDGKFVDGIATFSLLGITGFTNKQGQVVIPAKYFYIKHYGEGLFPAHYIDYDKDEGKDVICDKNGKELFFTPSSLVGKFSEGLICVRDGNYPNLYGFMNAQGQLVIPYQFELDQVYDRAYFSEGLACVRKNEKWGHVNKQGQMIVPMKYDDVTAFSEGLAYVKLNNKWGYVNKQGQMIIPMKYDGATIFSEGLACVKLNNKWGVINKQGQVIVPMKYDDAYPFSEGMAKVSLNKKWGFINKQGKEVIPLVYDEVERFSEGLACAKKDKKYGYINKDGNTVIPFTYSGSGRTFHDGLACVDFTDVADIIKENGRICYISRKTGEKVATNKYYDIENLLSFIISTSRYGFIDKSGKEVLPFEEINGNIINYKEPYSEGYLIKEYNGKKVYVDRNGRELKIQLDDVSIYNAGLDQERAYKLDYKDKEPRWKWHIMNALALFSKSAEMGNPAACYKLGYYYFNGIGFHVDYAAASKWLKKSLSFNNGGENYRYLALCYYDGGNGLEKNPELAFHYLSEGAKLDNDLCYHALCICYAKGYGCKKNLKEACRYIEMAYPKRKDFYSETYVTYHNLLAYEYAAEKNYVMAMSTIDKAIQVKPKDADLFDTKGELYTMTGQYDKAYEMWKKVLELDPRFLDHYPQGTELSKALASKGYILNASASVKSMLCTYKGGYFIRNGNNWHEYRPQERDGVWNSYTQYSEDNNYYYIKNQYCYLSIPKEKTYDIWMSKNGKDYEKTYTCINIYNYCPVLSNNIFAYPNGFFVKNGDKWQEYDPHQKTTGALDSFTQYNIDKDFYYIKNTRIHLAIPRTTTGKFHFWKNEKWVVLYDISALYDAQSPNAGSGQ